MSDGAGRDRDPLGKARNARPRDELGRPLPHGAAGVPRIPDDYAPSTEQAIADARAELAAGRAFHAHEVFEGRWKNCPPAERDLWQGLAQLCVGLTHRQRHNPAGAATLTARGADRLRAYAEREPYGIDLDAAVSAAGEPDVDAAIRALRAALG